jgi:hypothetical protein
MELCHLYPEAGVIKDHTLAETLNRIVEKQCEEDDFILASWAYQIMKYDYPKPAIFQRLFVATYDNLLKSAQESLRRLLDKPIGRDDPVSVLQHFGFKPEYDSRWGYLVYDNNGFKARLVQDLDEIPWKEDTFRWSLNDVGGTYDSKERSHYEKRETNRIPGTGEVVKERVDYGGGNIVEVPKWVPPQYAETRDLKIDGYDLTVHINKNMTLKQFLKAGGIDIDRWAR